MVQRELWRRLFLGSKSPHFQNKAKLKTSCECICLRKKEYILVKSIRNMLALNYSNEFRNVKMRSEKQREKLRRRWRKRIRKRGRRRRKYQPLSPYRGDQIFSSMSFSADTQTLGCSVWCGNSGVLKSIAPRSGWGKGTTNFLAQSQRSGICSFSFSRAQLSVCPRL